VAATVISKGIVEGTMVDFAFWRDKAQRFAAQREKAIQQSRRPLNASNHPEGWGFEHVRAFQDTVAARWMLGDGTPRAIEEFKSVASLCAVALGSANTDAAWAEWLDYLRRDSSDFRQALWIVSSRSTERRPDPDVEIPASGLLYHVEEVRPDPDAETVPTELGEIDDVYRASERLCCRLSDEAQKGDLTQTAQADAKTAAQETAGVGYGMVAPPDSSRTVTVKEAAQLLPVHEDTLHRMRKRNEIDMFKAGSQWRVRMSEVVRVRQQPKYQHR